MKLALAAAVLVSALVVGHSRPGACDPAPRVLQYWHEQSPPTAPGQDALMIQLDEPVAAVVARWTYAGTTTAWTVVPRTAEDRPGVTVIALGDLDGGSPTLATSELQAGGHLDLMAIDLDGSRVAIRGLPSRLSTAEMPTDHIGLGRALQPDVAGPPPEEAAVGSPLPADWNPMRGLDDALGWALGAIGLLTLGVIAAFRLRPTLRDPSA